jgi:hypothetical protein
MATYDPYGEEIIGLRQKQALAQKLRESAQMPQGQMVSGWYVKPSITQYLAQGLQGYMGAKEEADIEKQIKGIGEQRKAENKAWLESTPKEQTYQVEDRSALPEAQQTQMGPSPYSKALRVKPTTDETLAWAMKAPGLDTGAVAQLGVKGAELEAGRQARIAEAHIRADEKREAQEREQRNRQDNMRFAASLRPAPPERIVNILGPNGESVATPISQVPPSSSLWSPQAAKFAQENASKGTGRGALSDTLNVLAGQYNALNQGMGMPSTQNKWGSNLAAKLATTGVGQWAGQVAGTENQKARDIISQTRPLLLADIKKATGMTASEMNSNAELQMWLSVATDPAKGYEANMEALKNLENKFGLGRAKDGNPFLKATPAANQNVTVDY